MGDRSPFATGFLVVEIYYSGAWHDITADVGGTQGGSVVITREVGRAAECRLSLANPTGEYSPRNPSSSLFGLIGRGTPIRVSTEHTGATNVVRFLGEVVEWPQKWTLKGAQGSYAPIVAAGTLRRIGQGASPLTSVLRRGIDALGTAVVAYWPCEDESGATRLQTATAGALPAEIVSNVTPAAYTDLVASRPLPTLQSGRIICRVPNYTNTQSPVEAQTRWMTYIPTSTTNGTVLVRVACSGTLAYVQLAYVSASNSFQIDGIDESGANVGTASGWLSGSAGGKRNRVSLELTQSGANVSVTLATYEVGADSGFFNTGSFTGVTIGRVTRVDFNPTESACGDMMVGHVTVEPEITSLFSVSADVLDAYNGEPADVRIERLCSENGISTTITGPGDSELVGYQAVDTLPNLLDAAAAAGGGFLFDGRSTTGLRYRELDDLYSQTPALTITYTDNLLLPFEPVEDDQATRNRVTVTRDGGSSSTVEVTDGPLGTDAVGVYDETVTLSLGDDDQTSDQAGWRAHLGTVDEARWPAIGLDLAHPTFLADSGLTDDILGVDLGDLITVTDLPAWLPPFDVNALVTGYTETIEPLHHRIEWAAVPGSPYRVGYYDSSAARYAGTGTVTAEDLDATETGVDVTLPTGVAWGHDDGDYGVVIGGELMTVTAVGTASGGSQTLTVVRSVNGVVKTHTSGSAVDLADPCYYGL